MDTPGATTGTIQQYTKQKGTFKGAVGQQVYVEGGKQVGRVLEKRESNKPGQKEM